MKRYNGILEIRNLDRQDQVNRALEIGWKLLDSITETHGERGWFSSKQWSSIKYIVGRTKEGIPDPENWIKYAGSHDKPTR